MNLWTSLLLAAVSAACCWFVDRKRRQVQSNLKFIRDLEFPISHRAFVLVVGFCIENALCVLVVVLLLFYFFCLGSVFHSLWR